MRRRRTAAVRLVVRPGEARPGDEPPAVELGEQPLGEVVVAAHVGDAGPREHDAAAEVVGEPLRGGEHRRDHLGCQAPRRPLQVGLIAELEDVDGAAVTSDRPADELPPGPARRQVRGRHERRRL
jgi:hypothetical protein